MAEPDVGADTPLSPQLFDGGVHVKGAPGDDSVRDEVQTEDLVGLLISLTALDLALVSEEQEAPEGVEGLSFVQLAVDPTTVVLGPPDLRDRVVGSSGGVFLCAAAGYVRLSEMSGPWDCGK